MPATKHSVSSRQIVWCYNANIMMARMARTQISLDAELHRVARKRAADLGISLAEYVRRLIGQDLGTPRRRVDPSWVFDLGASGGSNIARNKDEMIGEAIAALREQRRRR